ncbi:class I SAM-dependent RNA methyltransferase [Candidatus Saccharibacteria bacterium]|nr:class I SAM-dependent RNA methyltransferase [Candidatus Saccharibacteria bacterium]
MLEKIVIEKLVHGGQGLGTLPNGQKIFVWNGLPGETVGVRVGRKKKDYAEGFAEEIITASKDRITPVDEAYLSTSPWQIMTFDAENSYKKEILTEAFTREGMEVPEFDFVSVGEPLHYRNKMEYSFWGDDDGLHLALYHRASHGKRIVMGSSIARSEIDDAANKVVAVLNSVGIRGGQLKTVIVRTNKEGDVVVALFVKDKNFPKIEQLDGLCNGLAVYYSNPKSPASIITEELYSYGDNKLHDTLAGLEIAYDVNSFFQVNLAIFEESLLAIKKAVKNQKNIIDMYAGVGTIGLAVGAQKLVEMDAGNIAMATYNAKTREIEIVHASTEEARKLITKDACVIFDPPRAGLHDKVIDRLLEVQPVKIVYLSCNSATQARDIAKLQGTYKIASLTGYNFFPRTPHIESLAILQKSV